MRRTITLILISLLLSLSACGSEKAPEGGLSAMETEDIYGTPCTSAVFKENKVTLVNVFATWCTPCIAEFPHLEQLPAAVEGVGVVAVVSDAVDAELNVDEEALAASDLIAQYTGVTFPLLIPDQVLYDACVSDLPVVPQSFFVDENGQVISEIYQGARSTDDWAALAREALASLE